MNRLGKAESPVVERTFNKRQHFQDARRALSWGCVNMALAIAMFLELSYGSLMSYFSLVHPWIWYAECVLAGLFTFNTLVDFMRYLSPSLYSTIVELTPRQKRLMGVGTSDPGFMLATPRQPKFDTSAADVVVSPSSFSSGSPLTSTHYSPATPPRYTPPGARLSPSSATPSPHQHRTPSPGPGHYSSGSPGMYGGQSLLNTSGLGSSGYMAAGPHSYSASPNASVSFSFNRSGTTSPHTMSPLFHESFDSLGLRSRFQNVSKTSPLKSEECMSDMKSLQEFLTEQKEKELRAHLSSTENSPSGSPSFWNYNRSVGDYSHILRKYQYQIACRSPQSTKSKDDDADESVTYEAEEVWRRLGIYRDDIDRWIENLRKWLCQTVMARIMNEIDAINQMLTRIGSEDRQIGEVGISTLKQLAVTKGQLVPHLNSVVPFLEVCANQEYLVQRIRELGSTGCMSAFTWNGGGQFAGKPWGEHLPTDAAIVMHMLCTYMDNRLPPHPKYPDGKTFTSQYFLKTPDKPNLEKKDNLCIYQTKISPPHYKVVIEDDIWNLNKGRNNMFHAILLFLHHVKTKEHGMLGHVNLGLSGINLLWVLDS